MPVSAIARRHPLVPLAVVTGAALVFALLLLVRLQWAPLESADHHVAAWLNGLVAGNSAAVGVIKAVTWLGLTVFAFELYRQAGGDPVTDLVTEGLEPEARADLTPAEPETNAPRHRAAAYGRTAAGAAVAWVLIVGALTGIGKLIMSDSHGNGNILGDSTIPHWLATRHTPARDHWSLIASNLGASAAILIVSVAACVVFIAVTRHWRPVVFLAVVMVGELAAFLTVAAVVKRPRAG